MGYHPLTGIGWWLAFCTTSMVGALANAEGTMCGDQPLSEIVAVLAKNMETSQIRVIVTVGTEQGQNREAIEQKTHAFALSLSRAGATTAEPIGGQPLVVAELTRDELLLLADNPSVVCVTPDEPEGAD